MLDHNVGSEEANEKTHSISRKWRGLRDSERLRFDDVAVPYGPMKEGLHLPVAVQAIQTKCFVDSTYHRTTSSERNEKLPRA